MTAVEQAISERIEEELAVAIARARGDERAGKLARSVLEVDPSNHLLLGLTEGARMAVYYDSTLWGVRFVPIRDDGLQPVLGNHIEKRNHRRGAESFVREHLETFEWLHPRVRWVAEFIG